MAGRRPTPTQLKILNGNPGKRAIRTDEPNPAQASKVCPEFLTGDAAAEWDRVVGELVDCGILTLPDLKTLEAYCVVYGQWREIQERMKSEDWVVTTASGGEKLNPLLTYGNTCLDQMRKYLIEMGMTPAARSRVRASPIKNDNANKAQGYFKKAR